MATNYNSITRDGYFDPVGYRNENKALLENQRRKAAMNQQSFLKGQASSMMSPQGAEAMGAQSNAIGGVIPGSASAAGIGGGSRGGGGFSGMGGSMARIGNRGGVMAPASQDALQANGRSGMGTLTDFYASRTVDPATGLPLNPSSMDRFNARAGNESGGLYQGGRDANGNLAGGGGLQGFQRQGMMDAFYQGVDEQDPFMAGGARQALLQQNAMRNTLGGAAAQSARGFNFGPNYEGIDGREDGGPFGRIKPYLVGEEGPEVAVYKDGQAEVIGAQGPEVRVFHKPGKVIPNDEITPLAEGGEYDPSAQAYAPGTRAGSRRGRMPSFQVAPQPPAPTLPSWYKGGRRGALGTLAPPAPANPALLTKMPRASAFMADPFGINYEEAPDQQLNLTPSMFANRVRGADDSLLVPEPLPATPMDNLPMAPSALDDAIFQARRGMTAPTSLDPITGRTVANKPVMALSEPQSTEQVFQTKYGKAGVNFGPKKEEALIEGLPASEWFQRRANAQGEANKYAKPEKGYTKK